MSNGFVKALIDEQWEKIKPENSIGKKNVMWTCYISPPFPLDWPPILRSRFRYYGYAYGLDISGRLMDGAHVSAPWVLVEASAEEKTAPKVLVLSNELKDIGIQGVEPLPESESRILARTNEVGQYLFMLQALPEEASEEIRSLRDYYNSWLRYNGILADNIRPHHERFFRWLGRS